MSSSTDPYIPQEKTLRLTRALLEEMTERPPDVLVIQSHHTMVERDIDLIADLSTRGEVWVSLTVETDMDRVPGLPPHASPPGRRLATLEGSAPGASPPRPRSARCCRWPIPRRSPAASTHPATG